ncbi:general secretion pathway protein GspB [Massilia jejuensis]|uniref:General secretion pathway protein GspB n=1 Tax=Massilia jejuensis TaxID=648894 RepID=A0ABW0PJH5_9BURK
MSYILEALKKAQAERQLGNAPGIHTPQPVHAPVVAAGAQRKPLLVGLGAGVVVVAVAAGLMWRARTPAGAPAVLAQAGKAAPGASAQSVPAAPAAMPVAPPVETPPASGTPVPPAQPARVVRDTAPLAPPAALRPTTAAAPHVAPVAPAPPVAAREAVPEPVYLPAPARSPEPAPAPARAPDPIVEEHLRTLQQLPEAIQREVPKVAVGGYIYSPNPADRLLLVDKMLRREGEELAPGLVLERLMPKYAVMNFRGTRYRVGY